MYVFALDIFLLHLRSFFLRKKKKDNVQQHSYFSASQSL